MPDPNDHFLARSFQALQENVHRAGPAASAGYTLIGAIGVVGPTRMNYARIIPMVDYTSKVVGRLLGRRDGKGGDASHAGESPPGDERGDRLGEEGRPS